MQYEERYAFYQTTITDNYKRLCQLLYHSLINKGATIIAPLSIIVVVHSECDAR